MNVLQNNRIGIQHGKQQPFHATNNSDGKNNNSKDAFIGAFFFKLFFIQFKVRLLFSTIHICIIRVTELRNENREKNKISHFHTANDVKIDAAIKKHLDEIAK